MIYTKTKMDENMKSKKSITIDKVVKSNLCTGCSTCVSLCSNSAIKMNLNSGRHLYEPIVDSSLCNNCGMCLKVCPGNGVDFNLLNDILFQTKPKNHLIGNYINIYTGHSSDYNTRFNSSSGGMVTQLLSFMLKEKIVDGVVVIKNDKNMLEPYPILTNDINEVFQSKGSKYCPVPVNSILKEIMNRDGKFVVVGLPCHIQGIRKATQINKSLSNKIICFGLICNHSPNSDATRLLLEKFEINIDDVKKINWRGNGWPGGVIINMKDGKENFIPSYTAWKILNRPEFWSLRCTICTDTLCELADISFGDAWLPKYVSTDKIGTNIIVARTKLGDDMLNSASDNKEIELEKSSPNDLINSQKGNLYFKKNCYKSKEFILKLFKLDLPRYEQTLPRASVVSHIYTINFYARYLLAKLFMKHSKDETLV